MLGSETRASRGRALLLHLIASRITATQQELGPRAHQLAPYVQDVMGS